MGLPILFTLPQNSFNWLHLHKDFDKFVNQLSYEFKKQRTQHQEQGSSANNDPQSLQHQISNKDENNNLPPPPVKQRFRIHKSDIKTNKDGCGTTRHFNNVCCHPSNPHSYLKVQLIEQVQCNDAYKDIEAILWEREKYWESQLFTNVYGMNSVSDLYSRKRKGCRRK